MNRQELTDELMEIVLEHGVEDVLKSLADVLRGAEDIAMSEREYPQAGTLAYYAHSIEQLFEE